jgi:hypothetical protein
VNKEIKSNHEITRNDTKFFLHLLHAKTNKLEDLKLLIPQIVAKLSNAKKGEVTHIGVKRSQVNSDGLWTK